MTNESQTSIKNSPIVLAKDVYKTYSSGGATVHALRGISLTVHRGEMVAIMGPSGCGKTTLLNTLSGLDSIDSGTITIDKEIINKMSDRTKTDYRARHMGFVFQFFNLLPVLSAVENVELPLLLTGVPTGKARQRAIESLQTVGLKEWANHRPKELSGGQQQRTTIARALVNEPTIVWADEPTGNLDSAAANEMMALIETLNEKNGQTFVIVTHNTSIGERTHRVINMRDGEIDNEVIHRPFQPITIPQNE